MKMFSASELKVFLDEGVMSVQVALILTLVADGEPELMAFWVYVKRIKKVPASVYEPAMDRLAELLVSVCLSSDDVSDRLISDVMNAVWDRLDDDERHRLLHSI